MSLVPGSPVGRYRIVRALGAGGMGEVFEAEDTRLGRRVALKFLPQALAGDRLALDRFEREARAASALNHPHICTIYDMGEADPPTDSAGSGQAAPYIAMELLEGQTLRARLPTGRPATAVGRIVDLGLQLADALRRRTRRASFIATSSLPTSSSPRAARPSCWTSAWPSCVRAASGGRRGDHARASG